MLNKETLPIEFAEIEPGNFHLFMKVKIGRKNARLLLDTGASKTVLDQSRVLQFIQFHHLKSHDIASVGLGSNSVETQLTQLSSMGFGTIKIKPVEVAVLDLSHVNQTYAMLGMPVIDGVLGSDILYQLKAVIDYGTKRVRLKWR